MDSGFLFLTIGMLFITGVFCLVIALNQLAGPQAATNVRPMPRPENDDQGDGPKLTKLGRPIEEVKLRA
jgi:hypothetical protein